MNKKIWISPEVIILGVENTEAKCICGKQRDGEYVDLLWWEIPLRS